MPTFDPVDPSPRFPELEQRVLAFWKEGEIFQKSLTQREGKPRWIFYQGPPTANGRPHPGHVITLLVKDLFPRYKTMRGFQVPRKGGWDTHGLPVEVEVEKELKISGKQEIERYGIEAFVRKCMDSVFSYTEVWEDFTDRVGFWVDQRDPYVTYHKSYVESVWWSLQQLHKQGLLYQGHKILPWCPRCRTALSSHEVGQGYEEVEDPSVFVAFASADAPNESFLAWTTTPWTLPSNAGLAVKADTEYSHVKVEGSDEVLILASALVPAVMGKLNHEVVKTEPGTALVGRRYKPLFDWWRGTDDQKSSAWKVTAADFVALDTGTGIVHIAPAFGADDYALGQREGLPVIQLVDAGGNFTAEAGSFAGRFCKEADNDLIKDLRSRGRLLKREVYKHDYPFCWRCRSPLIYFARTGWFIRTTREIRRVIDNNQHVNWIPEHIKNGRFGNFLESNVDWALSRERYWGTPLPIWKCEKCEHQTAIASFEELKRQKNPRGLDAFDRARAADPTLSDHLRVHKPWIDEAAFDCPKCGATSKRAPEVIDCWYDSGAMPFAQWGYPHLPGSTDQFKRAFPADFISEAIDQTRGWFYTLLAESTLLFPDQREPHPYKTCIVLGLVGDEKGIKMSKSKKNYIDPFDILKLEGADALRWFFCSSTNPWNGSRFSRPNVRDAQREFLLKLRNVYSFFVIYANIDGFTPTSLQPEAPPKGEMDRWILSELHSSIASVTDRLDSYDIYGSAQILNALLESISNWWLQRSRERFWRSWHSKDRSAPEDRDKLDAYRTFYECLATVARMIAPFVPFTAEELWQNLSRKPLGEKVAESVHLADWPAANETMIDRPLAEQVALVREIVSLGRAARNNQKLKVRLPLSKLILVLADPERFSFVHAHEDVLKDALNVKAVEYARNAGEYVDYQLKPNFKNIGAKYRELVPAIKQALGTADAAKLQADLAGKGTCTLQAGGKSLTLGVEEVEVGISAKAGYAAASGTQEVVILDTHLTPELVDEGFARELVSLINGFRAEMNLPYEERIKLWIGGSTRIEDIAARFRSYIGRETLSGEPQIGVRKDKGKTFSIEVEGEHGSVSIMTT